MNGKAILILPSIVSKLVVVIVVNKKYPGGQVGQDNYHVAARGNLGWGGIEYGVVSSMQVKRSDLEGGIDLVIGRGMAIKILHMEAASNNMINLLAYNKFAWLRVTTEPLVVNSEIDVLGFLVIKGTKLNPIDVGIDHVDGTEL
eukprot:1057836-Ditylum_brightwellii.AAC.1